jgi:hypothetical protein
VGKGSGLLFAIARSHSTNPFVVSLSNHNGDEHKPMSRGVSVERSILGGVLRLFPCCRCCLCADSPHPPDSSVTPCDF